MIEKDVYNLIGKEGTSLEGVLCISFYDVELAVEVVFSDFCEKKSGAERCCRPLRTKKRADGSPRKKDRVVGLNAQMTPWGNRPLQFSGIRGIFYEAFLVLQRLWIVFEEN